jgi:DNA end-binding protein Ku
MLDLATHIIKTKAGRFDAAAFDDRYEDALADLVKAKMEGRKIAAPKPRKETKVVDLMAALRESAGLGGKKDGKTASKAKAPAKQVARRRKAG